jgi:hypothetical protein
MYSEEQQTTKYFSKASLGWGWLAENENCLILDTDRRIHSTVYLNGNDLFLTAGSTTCTPDTSRLKIKIGTASYKVTWNVLFQVFELLSDILAVAVGSWVRFYLSVFPGSPNYDSWHDIVASSQLFNTWAWEWEYLWELEPNKSRLMKQVQALGFCYEDKSLLTAAELSFWAGF